MPKKEKIVGVRAKEIFQLGKENIDLRSGRSPKQLLMYCTRYLYDLQMKVSSTGASKGVLKTQTSHSVH